MSHTNGSIMLDFLIDFWGILSFATNSIMILFVVLD